MLPSAERLPAPPRETSAVFAWRLLLSGALSQAGWGLLAGSSLFFWTFVWHADLSGWRFRSAAVATASGSVLSCRETAYSVGGSDDESGVRVYENTYRYQAGGATFAGRSYATGLCLTGSPVTVEYLAATPAYSRIQGMRRHEMPPATSLVGILPLGAIVLIVAGRRKGRLRLRLYRDGVAAATRIADSQPTNASVNERVVWRVTLEFTTRGGTPARTNVRTNDPGSLRDESRRTVLYDPWEPATALPLGDFAPPRAVFLLPLLTVAVNAVCVAVLRPW